MKGSVQVRRMVSNRGIEIMGAPSLTVREGRCECGTAEARMRPVVLDWNCVGKARNAWFLNRWEGRNENTLL